jgi:pantoate--beta-alanine ligase
MVRSITTLDSLRQTVSDWRAADETVALVPTMGALHAGHRALVEAAKKHAARVIVSIFVNPLQFGPAEDFQRYPRPLENDLALLVEASADAAWLPTAEIMYPQGFATNIHVARISEMLEGAHRPGHFDGVATVVAKLFLQVAPDMAIFGEKDYQQLCLIKRLVSDLDIPLKVIGMETVREADGLALSSRNRYLSEQERLIAPCLHRVMQQASARIGQGEEIGPVLAESKQRLSEAGFGAIDYLELRAGETLAPLTYYAPPARLLAAAHLGTTRLIDNIRVE